MLNDECVLDYDGKPVMTDGKETPILEWMAAQKKRNFIKLYSTLQ